MKSRRAASRKNAIVAFIAQIVKLLGNFIVQTVFVKTLGARFLGANGLFTNLIVFLSFAELGIGSAFSFSLYKPLADRNNILISSIMSLYRKVYNTIGIVILFSGLVLSYFVPFLTKSNEGIEHIRFYFIMYLLSTVVSYFFTYNRSLLYADQCGYIDSINQLNFSLLRYIGQIVSLCLGSYFGYLLSQIFANLLANLSITRLTRKHYPRLNEYTKNKVPSKIISSLKRNVIGTISSKVGSIVVNGTDNILISKFSGLLTVGLYANYSLIISGITTLMNQVLNSVISSFGNLAVTEARNKDKQVNLFFQFTYYNAFSVFFIGLVLVMLFEPFIEIWIGNNYLLSKLTVNVIVINFVLNTFRPALYMINAYGLFWGFRYKSVIEALFNFALSFLLVATTNLGINGVLFGTILSNLVINSWWDPLILYSGAYGKGFKKFYIIYWLYVLFFLASLLLENILSKLINFHTNNFILFLAYSICVICIVSIYLFLAFYYTDGEKDLLRRLRLRRL